MFIHDDLRMMRMNDEYWFNKEYGLNDECWWMNVNAWLNEWMMMYEC